MLGPRACSRDVVEPGFKHRLSDLEPCSYTHSVLCRVLRDADSKYVAEPGLGHASHAMFPPEERAACRQA